MVSMLRPRAPSHPHRDQLFAMIRSNPGIHIRRMAHVSGLSWNTCLHHLRTMQREGLVVGQKVDGKVCFFDRTQGAYRGKEATCVLRDPDNLRLARQVLAHPGDNQTMLGGALGMAASVVHRRLARLESAGLVVRVPSSRNVLVFPTEDLVPTVTRAGLVAPQLLEGFVAAGDLRPLFVPTMTDPAASLPAPIGLPAAHAAMPASSPLPEAFAAPVSSGVQPAPVRLPGFPSLHIPGTVPAAQHATSEATAEDSAVAVAASAHATATEAAEA